MKIISIILLFISVQLSIFVPSSYSEESSRSAKERIQARRENIIQNRQDIREEVKQKREEAIEQFKEKREEFKEKLQSLRDERKKKLAENIDKRLSEINKKHTERMSSVLVKLNEILSKIKTKTEEAKTNGKDVASVEAAISEAEVAIVASETAVSAQAGKEYVASISDETKLRNAMGEAVRQLRADLKVVYQTVLDARKAVRNAAVEFVKTRTASSEINE